MAEIDFIIRKSSRFIARNFPDDDRAALKGRPACAFNYWPSCALIISWICFLTASRLKVAGACIGG